LRKRFLLKNKKTGPCGSVSLLTPLNPSDHLQAKVHGYAPNIQLTAQNQLILAFFHLLRDKSLTRINRNQIKN